MLSRQGLKLLLLSRKGALHLLIKGLSQFHLLLLERILGLHAHALLNNLLLLKEQLDLLLLVRLLGKLKPLFERCLQRLLQL